MDDMSLHVLDIAENSVNANATRIAIRISEDTEKDRLEIIIEDNGKGIDLDMKKDDPYYTEKKKKKRFGLGIPFFEQAAQECNGGLEIRNVLQGRGTVVTAWFQRSHIDLKPLGDMGSTLSTLVGGHPEIDYVFSYRKDDQACEIDTALIREQIEGTPLNMPPVLQYIREEVNEGVRRIRG